MIEYRTGDLFTSGCEGLVNPINTYGAMGAGLALEFRRRWPAMYACYKEACRHRTIETGKVWVWTPRAGKPVVLGFPTKRDWRKPSRLEWIAEGLFDLGRVIHLYKLGSVAVPALGVGLGGLDWTSVRACIESALGGTDCLIAVYQPH